MKTKIQLLTTLGTLATLLLITAPAYSKADNNLKFDLIESERAKVVNVTISKKDSTFKIKGKLRNKRIGRNVTIPGRVEISIIAADGSVVTTKKTLIRKINTPAVHRRNVNSRYASFQTVFKEIPASGSTIRIKHLQ
ncbi:MAG: hypothetical protein ACC653_04770 [Gammaproteobacteria bacterium]